MTDRQLPQDLDAEMACLGSMLMSRDAIDEVLQVISKADSQCFFVPANQKLFEILLDIHADPKKPIDLMVVSDELRRRELLEYVGGAEYMVQLSESFGDYANAAHYAKIVREKWQLRRLIVLADRLRSEACSPAAPNSAELATCLAQNLDDVAQAAQGEDLVPLSWVIQGLPDWWTKAGKDRVATGIPPLDELLDGGIIRGKFVIVAATTSIGKSSLATILARNYALIGGTVAYYMLESTVQDTASRIVSNARKRFVKDLMTGRPDRDAQMRAIYETQQRIPADRIWVTHSMRSVAQITSSIRTMKRRRGIGLAIIDYLQLVQPRDRKASRESQVAGISHDLQEVAKLNEVTVVALAQLNRLAIDAKPAKHNLRESGALEQDADIVLLLWWPKAGVFGVIVDKNRDGAVGELEIGFTRGILRFGPTDGGPEYMPRPRDEQQQCPF